jgi:hypothetical protein
VTVSSEAVEHQDRIAFIVGKIAERLVKQAYVRKKRTGFQDEIADCSTRTARPERCGGALHRYLRVSRPILIDAHRRSRCCERGNVVCAPSSHCRALS